MAIEKKKNQNSIAMGADYWFELISIETYVPPFIGHNNFFLGSVLRLDSRTSSNLFKLVCSILLGEGLPNDYLYCRWLQKNQRRILQ